MSRPPQKYKMLCSNNIGIGYAEALKKAVPRDFWIPVMILVLDTSSSDLKFLNSWRDYLHPKGNMGISIYEVLPNVQSP